MGKRFSRDEDDGDPKRMFHDLIFSNAEIVPRQKLFLYRTFPSRQYPAFISLFATDAFRGCLRTKSAMRNVTDGRGEVIYAGRVRDITIRAALPRRLFIASPLNDHPPRNEGQHEGRTVYIIPMK